MHLSPYCCSSDTFTVSSAKILMCKKVISLNKIYLQAHFSSNQRICDEPSHWLVTGRGFTLHDTVQTNTGPGWVIPLECVSIHLCVCVFGCARLRHSLWCPKRSAISPIFDVPSWPSVSRVWTVIEWSKLSKDPSETHPETAGTLAPAPSSLPSGAVTLG